MRLCALFVASLVFVLDRLTKAAALNNLSQGQSIKVFPGIFHFTLVLNKGSAFGLFKDQSLFFIPLSIIVTLFIIFYLFYKKNIGIVLSSALALILAGTLGNLVDRIRFGCVVDFLDFRIWPVFNVADSAITIGMVILAYRLLNKNSKLKMQNSKLQRKT